MNSHVFDTGDHVRIRAGDGSVLIIDNTEPDDLDRDMLVLQAHSAT